MEQEVEAAAITEILFLKFELSEQLLVVSVYDLPESLPVLPGHCLTLESDLQSLVWESEPVDFDLGKTRFQQVSVYDLLELHQLLRSWHVVVTESPGLVFHI